jgi:uncharacterized protein YndB with AHSA1/START domain
MAGTAKAAPAMVKAKLTRIDERSFHVERVFNAPLERVWRAHTEPKLLAQWWGRGNQVDIVTFELKKGGHWRFVEHSQGQQHGFEGRFAELVPMKTIAWTFEYDGFPGHVALDTLTFESLPDGRTQLSVVGLFMTKEDCDGMMSSGMEGGMNESYAALDRLLATLS